MGLNGCRVKWLNVDPTIQQFIRLIIQQFFNSRYFELIISETANKRAIRWEL